MGSVVGMVITHICLDLPAQLAGREIHGVDVGIRRVRLERGHERVEVTRRHILGWYRLDAAGGNRARNRSARLRACRSPRRARVRSGLAQPNHDVTGYMLLPKMDMSHHRRRSQVRISELIGSRAVAFVEMQLKFALALGQDCS